MTDQEPEPTFQGISLGKPVDLEKDPGPRYLFIGPEGMANLASHRPPDRWEDTPQGRVPVWDMSKHPAKDD